MRSMVSGDGTMTRASSALRVACVGSWLLLLAACGPAAEEPEHRDPSVEERVEEFAERLEEDILDPGPAIVADGGASTEFGRLLDGPELPLPEGFPDDIPMLDRSRVAMVHKRGGQLMVGYTVPLPWSATAEALGVEFRESGWWIEGLEEESGVVLFAARKEEQRVVRVSIGEHDRGHGSLVMLSLDAP